MGADFNKMYAMKVSLNTMMNLICLSTKHKYPMTTFDVSSAYLYSSVIEEVYVQPPTEIRPNLKGKLMCLRKAMYCTKQAVRCWW